MVADVEDPPRRAMCDQDIDVFGDVVPYVLGHLVGVGEAHWTVRHHAGRPIDLEALDLGGLVDEDSANLLEFLELLCGGDQFFRLQLELGCYFVVFLGFVLEAEVVVARDYDFVFVGQSRDELPEFAELLESRHSREISRVYEDVGFGPLGGLDMGVLVMGVRDGHDSYLPAFFLCLHSIW